MKSATSRPWQNVTYWGPGGIRGGGGGDRTGLGDLPRNRIDIRPFDKFGGFPDNNRRQRYQHWNYSLLFLFVSNLLTLTRLTHRKWRDLPWTGPRLSSLSSALWRPAPWNCWPLQTPSASWRRTACTKTSTRRWLWRRTRAAVTSVTAYFASLYIRSAKGSLAFKENRLDVSVGNVERAYQCT